MKPVKGRWSTKGIGGPGGLKVQRYDGAGSSSKPFKELGRSLMAKTERLHRKRRHHILSIDTKTWTARIEHRAQSYQDAMSKLLPGQSSLGRMTWDDPILEPSKLNGTPAANLSFMAEPPKGAKAARPIKVKRPKEAKAKKVKQPKPRTIKVGAAKYSAIVQIN